MRETRWAAGACDKVGIITSREGPDWIRQTVAEQLGQTLGRRVTLDRVDVQWLHLKAGLNGLTIYEADGQRPFVWVRRVQTQLSLASLRQSFPR